MKYYYECSLRAAYMAKHFGMRFQSGLEVNLHWNQGMSGRNWFSPHDAQHVDYYGNFYIHPDSLHLLDPQTGDLVDTGAISFYLSDRPSETRVQISNLPYKIDGEYAKIIQRNGIPFMWPESEP